MGTDYTDYYHALCFNKKNITVNIFLMFLFGSFTIKYVYYYYFNEYS